MGDKILERAAGIAPPFGDGVANSTNLRYTVTAASKVNQLPDSLAGEWINLKAQGEDCYWMISKNGAATVAVPAAADDGGAAVTNPFPLFMGECEPYELPTIQAGEHLYFVRISGGGTGSCWITKTSK